MYDGTENIPAADVEAANDFVYEQESVVTGETCTECGENHKYHRDTFIPSNAP